MEFYTNLVHYCKYIERYLSNKSEFTKKSFNCILTISNDVTRDACKQLTQVLHQSKQLNLQFNYDNFHFDFVSLFEYFYNEVLLKEVEFYALENICLVFKILKAATVNDIFCTSSFKFSDEQKTSLSKIYIKMIEVFNENGKQDWLSELSQNTSDMNILSDKEKALIDYMFSKLTSQFEVMNKQSSQPSTQTNSSEILVLSQETNESNRNLDKSKTRNRNVTFKSNYPEDVTDRSNLNKIKTHLEKILRYENHIKVLNEHMKADTAPSVMNVKFPPPLLPHDRILVDQYKKEIRNFHVNTMRMYTERLKELIEERKTEIAKIKLEQLKHLTDLDDIVDSLFIDLENSLRPKFISSLEKANRIINKRNDLHFESNSNQNDCSSDSIGSLNFETEANWKYNRAYTYDEQQRTHGLELSSNACRTQHSMHDYGHLNSFNSNFLNEQSNYSYNHRQNYPSKQMNHNRNNNNNHKRNNSRSRQGFTRQTISSGSRYNSRSNSSRFRNSRSNSRQPTSRNPIPNQQNYNFNNNRTSTPRTLRTSNNRNGNNNFGDSNYNKRYHENFQSQRRDHRPRQGN